MTRTLYAKLSVLLVALLLAVGATYLLVSFAAVRHYRAEVEQALNRDLARTLVADRNLVAEGRLDMEAVKSTFEQYMTINPSIEIYLLDLDGEILGFSADAGKVKRKRVSLDPIRAFLAGEQMFPLLGDDPRSHDKRKAFSVTPVPSESTPEGYLYVVLRGERYDALDRLVEESYFVRLSGWAVAASLAVGLGFGLIMFHLLTRRLQTLAFAMDRFRASGFSDHEPYARAEDGSLARADEIDSLGHNFDRMAERIAEQLAALEKQDAARRDLVAQISHDLRTPLAVLHGYLETLALSANDTPAQRREYLRVALTQSERLRRLVADLFELAKLEARGEQPALEPFAAAELAYDVAQKFKLKADHQQKTIDVHAAESLPLAVGDVALIERVLDNLIDNALSHTHAGGRIGLGLRADGDRLSFWVADDGPGIAAADREHVFERFAQSRDAKEPNMAGNDGDHAGLGLAIARRIVRLHGGALVLLETQDAHALGGGRYRGAAFEFSVAAR